MEWYIPFIVLYLTVGLVIAAVNVYLKRNVFGEKITIWFLIATIIGAIFWIFILGWYSIQGYRIYKQSEHAIDQAIEETRDDESFKEYIRQLFEEEIEDQKSADK